MAHVVGNRSQTVVGIRHTDIFRLAAVDAAAQHPAARDAVVHIAPLAIETLAAERLDIHSDPIARLDLGDFRTYGLNDANQFMPYGNPDLRLRHSPMQKRSIC